MAAPVMPLASSVDRNTTIAAISAAVAHRDGSALGIAARFAALSMMRGRTQLAVMPSRLVSSASDSVQRSSAAVAAAGVGRRVPADEVCDDVQSTPRAEHLLDEGVHRGAIARIHDPNEDTRIIRWTGQVTKRVAQTRALGFVSDRCRDVRGLLEIGAKDRRADVSSRSRKYYGALREIEHRG